MVSAIHAVSLEHALRVRKDTGAIPYAGGTDIMVRYRRGPGLTADPGKEVLFINRIPELSGIDCLDTCIRIRAATTHMDLIQSACTPPVLREACRLIGAPAVQNAGTIGGNLCNASPAADTVPPLAVLDATVTLQSAEHTRTMPVLDFITGPGTTVLRDDELLTCIRIPGNTANRFFYRKIGTRRANALSKASFAALAEVENHVLTDIRMAFGAVGPTVIRCPDLEDLVKGKPVSELRQHLSDLINLYADRLQPISDQRSDADYRRTVCLNMIQTFIIREVI